MAYSSIPESEFLKLKEEALKKIAVAQPTAKPVLKPRFVGKCRHAEDTGEPVIISRPCRGNKIRCTLTGNIFSPTMCHPDFCKYFDAGENAARL